MNTLRIEIENSKDLSVLEKFLTDLGFKYKLESDQDVFENISEAAGLGIAEGLKDLRKGRILGDQAARVRIDSKISQMKNRLRAGEGIDWTDGAVSDYEVLTEYLFETWGEDIAMRVLSRNRLSACESKIIQRSFRYLSGRMKSVGVLHLLKPPYSLWCGLKVY